MRARAFLALLAVAVAPLPARGDAGLVVAVRGGAAALVGAAPDHTAIGDAVPFWLEVGYAPIDGLVVGGYCQLAFGQMPQSTFCRTSGQCSGRIAKAGVELLVRPLRFDEFTPWAGVGAGFAWGFTSSNLHAPQSAGGTTVVVIADPTLLTRSYDLIAQAGADFAVAGPLSVGPYVAVTYTGPAGAGTTRLEGGLRLMFTP